MAKIINLRSARKQRNRAERKAAADVKAARFGRSAAQRKLEEADQTNRTKRLEGHLRERGASDPSPDGDKSGAPDT